MVAGADLVAGDETFDISVDKALWLMVSVRDRALVGNVCSRVIEVVDIL